MNRQLSRLAYVIAVLCLARAAVAQPQQQQDQQKPDHVTGIVLGAESRTRFYVVDKTGNQVAVELASGATFMQGNDSVNFEDLIKPGNVVRCMFDQDGRTSQVLFRGQASQLDTKQMRHFMGLNDTEWQVISDRIDHIRVLQRIVDGHSIPANKDPSTGGNSGPPPENPIRTQMKTLQQAFWDLHMSPSEIESNLRTLRELKAKARADLQKARQELTELVTPRQEILLVLQGILD